MERRHLCGGLNYWAEGSKTGAWESSVPGLHANRAGVRPKTFTFLFSKQILEIFAIMAEQTALGLRCEFSPLALP